MFKLPGCPGAPVRDGGRCGRGIGVLFGGSETLRLVLDFCGFGGTVGDPGGSMVRDSALLARGRRG
jgi:hypothetical protein